jgi:CubicO group peptidase (beta-lactamase class C family)
MKVSKTTSMKYTTLSLLLILLGNIGFGQSFKQSLQKRIDSLVEAKAVPGIIIGIYDGGRTTYLTAGYANVDTKLLFDSTVQLEIGSITKTFTAFILSAVLREKKIADTEAIGRYLPDSVRANLKVADIQFIQLLNHTSGFPRLPTNMGNPKSFLQPYAGYDLNGLFSYLTKATPDTPKKANYSNLGITIAGVLAERISGKSYEALLKNYITGPWDLPKTGLTAAPGSPVSVGYFNNVPAEYWTMNGLGAAGEIKSNARDIMTYLQQMLAHSNEIYILNLITPTAIINDRLKVAKAWHVLEVNGQPPIVWHNGGTYGFSTFCGFDKINNKAVFVAINAFSKNSMADNAGVSILKELKDKHLNQ